MKTHKHTDLEGSQHWYVDDLRHRDDGPAVIYIDGEQQWYQHDQLHRLDGPAVISANGHQRWYKNGHLHRLDGPAIIYSDGAESYYINDIKLKYQDWLEKRTPLLVQENLKTLI